MGGGDTRGPRRKRETEDSATHATEITVDATATSDHGITGVGQKAALSGLVGGFRSHLAQQA